MMFFMLEVVFLVVAASSGWAMAGGGASDGAGAGCGGAGQGQQNGSEGAQEQGKTNADCAQWEILVQKTSNQARSRIGDGELDELMAKEDVEIWNKFSTNRQAAMLMFVRPNPTASYRRL